MACKAASPGANTSPSHAGSIPPRPRSSRGVKIVVALLLLAVGMVTALSYAFLRLATP